MIGGILVAAAVALGVGDCVKDPSGRVYKVMEKNSELYILSTTDGSGRIVGVPAQIVEEQGKKAECTK